MKKAVYTLTMAVLVFSLAGCGAMGLVEDILPSASPAAGTPAVSASPAVVTPDVEDGIVKDPVETAFGVQSWKRKDIRGVYVLDTLEEMPVDAVDLSESGNGSVMGWLDAEDNLYIAGEGGVKAPKDASGLFAWYQNAQVIDPGGNLHTEDTTDFRYMFYHNYKAQKINLTGMDTGKAETFSKMFAYCESITQLDFSSFETSCCRSFYQMFIQCISLKKLDLTTFNPVSAYTIQGKTF